MIPSGSTNFEFSNICTPSGPGQTSQSYPGTDHNFQPIFLPLDIDQGLGGFSPPLDGDLRAATLWREGDSQLLIEPVAPVSY